MTRAVHFDGSAGLTNQSIGQSTAFAAPFGCGIVSYWIKNPSQDGVILVIKSQVEGHCLRLHYIHGKPFLWLQDPRDRNRKSLFFEPLDATLEDNNWHNICFGWNVNTLPYVVEYTVDSSRQPGNALTWSDVPTPFEVDYSIADSWNIGAEDPAAMSPVVRDAYEGDLAELYLSCLPIYLNILHPVGFTVRLFGREWIFGGKGLTTINNEAMEIGPNGVGATGIPPHLYCRVSETNQIASTFRTNNGRARGTFIENSASLTLAFTDPFP